MPVGFNTNTQAAKAAFKVELERWTEGGREGERDVDQDSQARHSKCMHTLTTATHTCCAAHTHANIRGRHVMDTGSNGIISLFPILSPPVVILTSS